MKKSKFEQYTLFSQYEAYTLDELVALVTESVQQLPEDQRKSARFCVAWLPDSELGASCFRLQYERLETDEEERAREASEALFASRQRERDAHEYERLKKIFENKAKA